MKQLPLYIFAIAALVNLSGGLLDDPALIRFSKPLLMPLLAWWFAVNTPENGGRALFRRSVIAALIFSLIGDVLLMYSGPLYFLAGLGSFLLAHLSYIGAFTAVVSPKQGYLRQQPLWIAPFALFPAALLWFLWEGIPPGMHTPVALYAGVISCMALSVLNTRERVSSRVFTALLSGALLFMASDSLIALVKFGHYSGDAHIAIMATYILGQLLLVQGAAGIAAAPSNRNA